MRHEPELIFRTFSRVALPTVESAVSVLQCFVDAGEPFVPARYGSYEPIRLPFSPGDLSGPAKMLSGGPRTLLLRRTKPTYDAFLYWTTGRDMPWGWDIDFDRGWLTSRAMQSGRIVEFLMQMCSRFPPLFAVCGTGDDWKMKHSVRDPETDADLGTRGTHMAAGRGLPGVYWFSFFGADLVSFFGRERLLNLPVEQVMDCGDSGVGVLVYNRPDEGTPEWRREREAAVAAALGEDYFFDAVEAMKKEPKARTPIPRVTDHG